MSPLMKIIIIAVGGIAIIQACTEPRFDSAPYLVGGTIGFMMIAYRYWVD